MLVKGEQSQRTESNPSKSWHQLLPRTEVNRHIALAATCYITSAVYSHISIENTRIFSFDLLRCNLFRAMHLFPPMGRRGNRCWQIRRSTVDRQ